MSSNLGCCAAGSPAKDNFQPQGELRHIGQIHVYESRPVGAATKGTLLLLPDGFGLAAHNMMLADMFAGRGFATLVPDYFEGDPVPISLLSRDKSKPPPQEGFDLTSWIQRHPHQSVERYVRFLYEHVRSPGTAGDVASSDQSSLAVVGYCFGGKHSLRASSWEGVQVAVALHPSFVQPDDVGAGNGERCCAQTYVGLAEDDEMVPKTLGEDLQRWTAQKYRTIQQRVFPGVGHGFAARPNSKVETEMVQFREAFEFSCAALENRQF